MWSDTVVAESFRVRLLAKGSHMTDPMSPPGSPANSLIERAKGILLKPAEEWPKIAAEPATPGELITRYAVPLAAIGPVATFLHGQLFGYGALGFSYKPGLMAGLSGLIVSYILGIVGIVVLALIADWLAPKFNGTSDRTAAFKLVVYGTTAAWLASVFNLIPGLGILGLAGLYSLYLYYTGAAPLMKVPQDKAAAYTGVTILCAIVLYIVIGAVSASFLTMFGGGMGSSLASNSSASGTLTVPGVGTLDLDKTQKAANDMQASVEGKKPAVDPAKLQGLLPAAIGGFARTATETSALGGMGSEAEGTYTAGDKSFKLTVTDMGAVGALAALGSAVGVANTREDANGYEKTGTVDGHMQSEQWRKDSSSGKFMVVVNNRFSIEASGEAGSIDELKAAVAMIDQGTLGGLAN